MAGFSNDSIFWIEIDKIKPNPYQPRHEFDERKLKDLAESIRQYGVLQPLVATRSEKLHEDGSLSAEYELIAGERRLRAARIAGLSQVPLIIRTGEDQNRMKLELAIIENLQREDLNPIDRAMAFQRLAQEFSNKHVEIGKKIGKSREYVSNSIRLLSLPKEMQDALGDGNISEGHARTLLMLADKQEEQHTLFREVLLKRLTVRETEAIARRIAVERVRKKSLINSEMLELEKKLTETLGTRVHIEQREQGGKIHIDYFSEEDLEGIMNRIISENAEERKKSLLNRMFASAEPGVAEPKTEEQKAEDDRPAREREEGEDIYSVKNFSI
ncbi:MAG TPA: ParB/RepB/Spo0J family partition protein [Candidatus Paceibacterota bacterium]|jgi:ParB family chromosome partitioning protein